MDNMESGRGNNGGTVESSCGRGIQMENPFAFKAFQVFTGFGVGCGIGIGVGSPLNLATVPMVGQVMSATRGATDTISGVSRHVNDALQKLGAKNIKAGIGCGTGFGHGFGVGLAVKPNALQRFQSCVLQATLKVMTKLGMVPPWLSKPPVSLEQGINLSNSLLKGTDLSNTLSLVGTATKAFAPQSQKEAPPEERFGTRTEQVITDFLENPILNQDTKSNEAVGRLEAEINMLRMVLKHQQVIEELIEENEKLRQILVEDLKVPPSKLETPSKLEIKPSTKYPCTDCFECQRRQKKNR